MGPGKPARTDCDWRGSDRDLRFHFRRWCRGGVLEQCHRLALDREYWAWVGGCEREGCLHTGALKKKECPSASELIHWSCRAEGKETGNFLTVVPIPSLPLVFAVAFSTALCICLLSVVARSLYFAALLSGWPLLWRVSTSLLFFYLSLFPCLLLTAVTFSFKILMCPCTNLTCFRVSLCDCIPLGKSLDTTKFPFWAFGFCFGLLEGGCCQIIQRPNYSFCTSQELFLLEWGLSLTSGAWDSFYMTRIFNMW